MTRVDWRQRVAEDPDGWVEVELVQPPVATRHHGGLGPMFWPAAQAEIARAYLDCREPVKVIADRYGISPSTVRKYALRAA